MAAEAEAAREARAKVINNVSQKTIPHIGGRHKQKNMDKTTHGQHKPTFLLKKIKEGGYRPFYLLYLTIKIT